MRNELHKTCPYCLHERTREEFAHKLRGERAGYISLGAMCGTCAVQVRNMRRAFDSALDARQELLPGILARPRVPFTDGLPRAALGGMPGGYVTLATPNSDGG